VGTKPSGAIISAQPQLRNMTAEVTKFMPTSLRVRRDNPKMSKPKLKVGQHELTRQISGHGTGSGIHMQGDAYDTFMHEMQGLL
jgi:WW domain-binding protein 11